MKSRFECISPADYEAAAVLVRETGEQMTARLDWVALKPQRIMEVGCGTGHCTQLLKKRYPAAELWAAEDSPAMLAYAKTALSSPVSWLYTLPDTLPVEDRTMDLVLSHLILPWCADFKKVFAEWYRVLRPEGLLTFSSFGPDTLRELQGKATQLPYFIDMHDLGDALIHAGFVDPVLDVEHFTLTYKEQQVLHKELQSTGFIGEHEALGSLEKNEKGVVPLTYEIIYGHAWKPNVDREVLAQEGIVKFPLSQLRGRRFDT